MYNLSFIMIIFGVMSRNIFFLYTPSLSQSIN